MENAADRRIAVIDGPNLNLLGNREVRVYGTQTYAQMKAELQERAKSLGLELSHAQSNHEGEIIARIQALPAEGVAWLVINPGAYTHTSIAIRDALLAAKTPAIEVHLSNPYARESFRHVSTISDVVKGRIMGLGVWGYILALEYIACKIQNKKKKEDMS